MATSVPAIIWPINFALQSGNPFTQSVASSAPLDSAQLIQGDQRLLQIYFLLAAVQQGGAATNVQLPAGATLTVAGKLANDLGDTAVLFQANSFIQLQDANALYFAQAFLNLDTEEIADAFATAGSGQNTLSCLVDVIVNVPAQAAAAPLPAVPASRATFQIAVLIKQQVYSGNEAAPTSAAPSASAASSTLLNAILATIGGVFHLANRSTGTSFPVGLSGADNDPSVVILPPGAAVASAVVFPSSSSGQAMLRNRTTGTVFPVVLTGADASPAVAILAPGSAIPPVTYQLDGSGLLTLLNQTTGTFLPVVVDGSDAAPVIEILPVT